MKAQSINEVYTVIKLQNYKMGDIREHIIIIF